MPVMLAMVVCLVWVCWALPQSPLWREFSDRVSLSSCVQSSQALVGRFTSSLRG